jgi:hypothetical protein
MPFQGLDQQEAEAVWRPFFDRASEAPQDFVIEPPTVLVVPARRFWDPVALRQTPGRVIVDDREGAPADDIFWTGDLLEAGQILYAHQSAWLPASLLEADQRKRLADALFSATKHRRMTLHVNKGLSGARGEAMRGSHDLDPELDRFTQCPPQEVFEAGDERTDVGRLRIEGLTPTEGEELRRHQRGSGRRAGWGEAVRAVKPRST